MLRSRTIKGVIIVGIAAILVAMPLYYFLRKATVPVETITKTIVSVDAPLISGALNLRNLNSVLAMEFDSMADSIIVFDGKGQEYADKSIRTSINREIFLEQIEDKNSDLPWEIVRNARYQRFASVTLDKSYSVYLQIGDSSGIPINNITINGTRFSAVRLNDDWYKVDGFHPEYATASVQADGSAIITDAFFVASRTVETLSAQRAEIDLGSKRLRTEFEINLPPESYVVVAPPPGIKLVSCESENLLGQPIELLSFEGGSNSWVRHLNALDQKNAFIVTGTGSYHLLKLNSIITPQRIITAYLLGIFLIYLLLTNPFPERFNLVPFFDSIYFKTQADLKNRSLGALLLMMGLLLSSTLLTSAYWFLPGLALLAAITLYSSLSKNILAASCLIALAGIVVLSNFDLPILLSRLALLFYLSLFLAAIRLWWDQFSLRN